VVESEAIGYVQGNEPWETGACVRMVEHQMITNYKHTGFWQCMDTLSDLNKLQELWDGGAPWIGKTNE
jgi:glucose-1-phosphate cytidylyltransferase